LPFGSPLLKVTIARGRGLDLAVEDSNGTTRLE
jgi:hypothetical protein